MINKEVLFLFAAIFISGCKNCEGEYSIYDQASKCHFYVDDKATSKHLSVEKAKVTHENGTLVSDFEASKEMIHFTVAYKSDNLPFLRDTTKIFYLKIDSTSQDVDTISMTYSIKKGKCVEEYNYFQLEFNGVKEKYLPGPHSFTTIRK
jgi:hypothetical protein